MVIHTSNNSALETEPGYEFKASLGSYSRFRTKSSSPELPFRAEDSPQPIECVSGILGLSPACIKLGVEAHSGEVAGDVSQKFKT